ncbi:MAG: ABC1 kinase family protein [Ktedonobacterales bacterium]
MAVVARASKSGHGRVGRYREIVDILARHGLGFLTGAWGPISLWPVSKSEKPVTKSQDSSYHVGSDHMAAPGGTLAGHHVTRPEHVRLAIEELGPTFIKLGQILSTRGDLLPAEYLAELAKLQDSAPPVPAEAVRQILQEELGRPVDEVFASFDMDPLASASIGQAHAATLMDGTPVVVKLRRPGVVEQVDEDLRILVDLAVTAERHWSAARYYDLLAIAQEFAQTLRAELDYLQEGRNVERFAENFSGDPSVHIPRVYWETTTSRMLTLERIYGIKISDVDALENADLDRRAIAEHATRILLTMILDYGFFHADPHPGNVFVEPDGRIALIDFGMVGEVDVSTQGFLIRLLLAIASRDGGRLADVVLDISRSRVYVDRNALRRDMQRMLARYCDLPLGDVRLSVMLGELLTILRWHHLRLPPDLALLVKTLGMSEGLGVQLDPRFNLMEVYVPYAKDLMRRRFSSRQWAGQFMLAGIDAMELALGLPQQLQHVLGDIERGGFEVNVQPQSFESYLQRMELLTNRLVLAILAAAFTVGFTMLVAAYRPAGWDHMAQFLLLFVLALSGGFGTYVLALILGSRHKRPG